ncbi:SGNH/GDSL hydrolase family protein [Psychroserpens damuponensis]|uniref:SGNH/GDSL hydrolase family protein n=1 Tax=Psychroserpens damuponensis TaxID=943936 RepID=UPI00058EE7D5|nr:SGNH/GDSL hydrolase family protein [Psychroserpens damuponensis]
MTIKKLSFLFSLIIVLTSFCGSKLEQIPKKRYKGIDRTLNLLNSSTKEHPNNVEILFYGQSIIGGMKTNILVDSLKKRFPFAIISFKHKPIGGFTIPNLIKTAEHDVYHENPDLIIFHAYDGIKDGLFDTLIKRIRQRMTSDILLLDHHYVWNTPESKLESINKSHDFDSEAIQDIARKYDCGFIDVRAQWKAYLENNTISPNELMGNTITPNVHPNDKGNALLRNIVLSKFVKKNTLNNPKTDDSLRTILNFDNASKKITTNFTGNRVEFFASPIGEEAAVEVLIDGKKPSEHRGSYYITRPSEGYQTWMPAIKNVSFGNAFPRSETWTVTLFDIDRETKQFKFKTEGSITGFDGEGNSKTDFISNSERIEIKKEDFYVFQIENIFKKETPEGFQIKFNVEQLIQDSIVIKRNNSKYTLFMSDKVNNHSLNIKLIKGGLSFKQLIVLKPYIIEK